MATLTVDLLLLLCSRFFALRKSIYEAGFWSTEWNMKKGNQVFKRSFSSLQEISLWISIKMITRWKKTFLFCRRRDWLLFEDLFQKASADYHVCEWFIHDFIPAFGQWLQSQYGTLLTDIALRGKVSCGCSFNRGTHDSVLVCLPYFPPKKGAGTSPDLVNNALNLRSRGPNSSLAGV